MMPLLHADGDDDEPVDGGDEDAGGGHAGGVTSERGPGQAVPRHQAEGGEEGAACVPDGAGSDGARGDRR